MGSSVPKQFLDLGGEPVLRRTIESFLSASPDIKVITVLPSDQLSFWKEYCLSHEFTCPQTLVAGGFTRFHSVRNALSKVPENAVVAIHDGVRPFVSESLIRTMFAKMDSGLCCALIPVVPSIDTLVVLDKLKDKNGKETLTASDEERPIDRSRIFRVQTPQMFLSKDIKTAYLQAFDTSFTDDASVAGRIGIPLTYCDGEKLNFKITTPEDLRLARLVFSDSSL